MVGLWYVLFMLRAVKRQKFREELIYFHSMTARVLRCVPPRIAGPSSYHRKMVLDVDLNVPPPEHSHSNEVGASTHASTVQDIQDGRQRSQPSLVTIDVDSVDDDVVLCSQRAFVEAKNKSRRSRSRRNIVDVELGSTNRDSSRNKRPRVPANQPIINCESYVIPERNANSGNGRNIAAQTRVIVAPLPPRSPPPPEPTFSCPVCLGPLVDEMSTKCGHIFCKECIKNAISAQSKCPTCRRKVTARDTIRVYLPKMS